MKEGIAVVGVGNRDVLLEIPQSNALDYFLLSFVYDIPDLSCSSLSQGCELAVQSHSSIYYSTQLSLEQVQLNVRP